MYGIYPQTIRGTSIKLKIKFCKRLGISVIKGIRLLESKVKTG